MIKFHSEMLTKTCKVCGRRKPLADFYRNLTYTDGLSSKCKLCQNTQSKAWREANKEHVRQTHLAYYHTERGRRFMYATIKAYMKRNPQKRAVHIMVGNAIRDGRLIRGVCETCGAEKVQAHHDNYDKPFEVRWFCRSCHVAHHKAEREAMRHEF